jgi:hypothetical protein
MLRWLIAWRMKFEQDEAEITGGVRHGRTLVGQCVGRDPGRRAGCRAGC